MTGYERSPDYGGPPFNPRELVVFAVIITVLAASLAIWALA